VAAGIALIQPDIPALSARNTRPEYCLHTPSATPAKAVDNGRHSIDAPEYVVSQSKVDASLANRGDSGKKRP
jgi:hypothetical protein